MGKLLREYQNGDLVDSVCILTGLSVKQTRQQKPFLKLEFGDSSGRVAGVMWEGFDEEVTKIPPGEILRIQGKMEEWEGREQVLVKSISLPPSGSYNPADLLPATGHDVEGMLAELDRIINSIVFPPLRSLLSAMFSDSEFRQSFAKAPAAKRWHQPYLGGLLEHTLTVYAHAVSLASRYPRVELELVKAGALVHDIGKTIEYRWENFFETSTQGRLLGHLVIGVEILDRWIKCQKDFPEELGWHLKHIILSHHGQYEFGCPVLPRTLEALVVHFADDLDAKISGVQRVIDREMQDSGQWTSYVKLMEREFFKGPVPPSSLEEKVSAREPPEKKKPGNKR